MCYNQKVNENTLSIHFMAYKALIVAIVVLLVVILAASLLPSQLPNSELTENDVKQIAENYVATRIADALPITSQVTGRDGSKWMVTVNYQQGEGAACKVGKCYWEGPASQFCRVESNQTLGACN